VEAITNGPSQRPPCPVLRHHGYLTYLQRKGEDGGSKPPLR
jgi:hypothetical protein